LVLHINGIDRYIVAILNSSKSPYRAAVAADIMGAILNKHAQHGQPAEYWDQEEQEQRLVVAFDKWADKCVWSAAAQKVSGMELPDSETGTNAIHWGRFNRSMSAMAVSSATPKKLGPMAAELKGPIKAGIHSSVHSQVAS
jgi:hypothetical protein